ncbi:dTDP-4-dehydrorhamnose reductase [uncultured Aquitalea sp.]|uniref:dTDP-4-dehydrorhamnose reductase n=1 Tax=uncultured Aquitalea sp. TaxID=540272 RepID=UPI0025CC18DB|nr:dTDP-4-dehydrorhamnose reductase [uncultured Aquitalea sp.]
MSRILITGANGQVGFELQRALAVLGDIVSLDRAGLDLTQPDAIRQTLDRHQPDIIVNPAAYTAVDKAESDADTACKVNAEAPAELAAWAAEHGALLIHYSTDYVYDGEKDGAYVETDAANPQSVYGASKLAGEQAIVAAGASHVIFRTSWVFGAHGANFLKTILRLAGERESLNIVADQIGAPTSAALLADVTAHVIQRYRQSPQAFPSGVYHLSAAGETSWFEYARSVAMLAEEQGLPLKLSSANIQPIPSSAYPTPAKRPHNSRLDCSKIRATFDIHLPDWQDGVRHVFAQLCQR